jgi:hypothetical protein
MYPGLPADEFTMILKALLPVHVHGNIIGLQGEQGEVVPITLSCRSPEILRDSTYVLLVSGETSSVPAQLHTEQVLPSAPPLSSAQQQQQEEDAYSTNIAPPAPPLKPSANPVYDDELTAEDAQEVDNTMDELLRFIAGLRVKRIINKAESDALEELLFSNRSLFLGAGVLALLFVAFRLIYLFVCFLQLHFRLIAALLCWRRILLLRVPATRNTWLTFAKTSPRA